MNRKFLILLLVLFIIAIVSGYYVYNYQNNLAQLKKANKQYEDYYNIEILGTELISIINKTVDLNEKNEIEKDEKGHYIDNSKDSINIYINFVYQDDIKTVSMEDIYASGSEAFVQR